MPDRTARNTLAPPYAMPPPHDDTTYGAAFADYLLAAVEPVYRHLAADYAARWGVPCLLTDARGKVIGETNEPRLTCQDGADCEAVRRQALAEAVRWGEPHVLLCPRGAMIWAVPILQNARLLGGLIAAAVPEPGPAPEPPVDPVWVRQATEDLLARAVEANLTNAALLELRRHEARRESARAEAIHAVKDHNYSSIRDIYLVEEPALMAAVKHGDRPAAREIINRILVGIYFRGRERPDLLKSFLMELVMTMSRTAVEAGADPAEVLGTNYSSFTELARLESEEEVTAWLVAMLERLLDAIHTHHRYPLSVLLAEALKYMQDHAAEDLSRDDVARIACLSPTHFSRVAKQTFGQSFTELLQRIRVEKAREMLDLTERSLVAIATDCGFSDQSYFTKIFQKIIGQTPGEYRRQRRQTP